VRKIVATMVVLGAMLCGPALHAGDAVKTEKKAESFKFLEAWIDKMPSPSTPPNSLDPPSRQALWEIPLVKASMLRTLGKERYDLVASGWGQGGPDESLIKRIDDNSIAVLLSCSRKRGCFNSALIYISMENGGVHVCWHSEEDLWLAPDGNSRKAEEGGCRPRNIPDLPVIYQKNIKPAPTQ